MCWDKRLRQRIKEADQMGMRVREVLGGWGKRGEGSHLEWGLTSDSGRQRLEGAGKVRTGSH